MASTNHQGPANQGHNLAIQRQQQELIKLLAQHFHHQFYQLSTGASGDSNEPQRVAQQAAYAYQLSQSHQNEQNLLHLNNRFDLNAANNSSLFQQNQTVRSQQFHAPTAISGTIPDSFLQDFSASRGPQNQANPYFNGGDLNVFNALGLNLTSNQLVLSLQQQQQSLLQAANAARQYDSRPDLDEPQANSSGSKAINQLDEQDNASESCKDALKFSISTILGSPQSSGLELTKSTAHLATNRDPSDRGKRPYKLECSDKFLAAIERDDNRVSSDCDPTAELGSDSNNSTPIPQPTESILLTGHSLVPIAPNHRSASQLNQANSSLQLSRQATLAQQHGHLNHQHQLPFLPGSTAFPWTVAARGKPRRGMMRRAVFSDSQRVGLEKRFQLQKYISKPDRKKLAEKLGLRDSQVKIWFQNRRMKWRNSKERELLSAGGSREQTLPTRNNPNPDLSDVGETISGKTTRLTPTTSSQTVVGSTNK